MKLLEIPRIAGDRVLIEIQGMKDIPKTERIVIPDMVTERHSLGSEIGYVVDIGKDAYVRKSCTEPYCLPGDYVLITQYSGKEYKHPETGKLYRIVKEDDVVAVIGKEDEIDYE